MIKAPSIQFAFDVAWSGDEAFVREGKTDDAFKAEFEAARDLGEYGPICKAGEVPTLFTVRRATSTEIRKWGDQLAAGAIGMSEASAIAFRHCVSDIRNAPGLDFKLDGKQVSAKTMDMLDSADLTIVTEIGTFIFARAMRGIGPK